MPSPLPDVVVVGAPRSGTSLVAQLLAAAGFAFGRELLPPSEANPRGFFEDVAVTELSDELLVPHLTGPAAAASDPGRLAWLAVLDADAEVTADGDQQRRMASLLPPAPACLKDPRFPYVLDAWRPALRPGTRFVGVVRSPGEVATSLRAMWRRDPAYYDGHEVTVAHGFALWEAMNRRLLRLLDDGDWMLVGHGDLLDGRALEDLGRFVGRDLAPDGVDVRLHRSSPAGDVPPALAELHEELLGLTAGARS